MSEKIKYKETFKKDAGFLKHGMTPVLRHQAAGFSCKQARLMAAGICELGGEQYEFQDIRVYLKEDRS
jgi:hypothetical protein